MIQTILTSLFLGLLAAASPCVLPLYPGFLAYLSGQGIGQRSRRSMVFAGFFVLLGVLSMMLLLGALIAALSVSIGRALSWLVPIADLIIIALGILLIVNVNPFSFLPQIQSPMFKHPMVNAFVYGLLYGPLTLPCSGPLVVAIFAYSFTIQEVLTKLVVLLGFGLGIGLPLMLLSLLSGVTQKWLVRAFATHARKIYLVGGLLLVGIGVYDLVANWSNLALYWRT